LRELVRWIVTLIVVPAAFIGAALTLTAAPAAASATAPTATPGTSSDRLASWVIRYTNIHRAKHGCAPVSRHTSLMATAQRHSWDMAKRGYFSHVSPGGSTFTARARYAGYRFASGENIAWGYRTPAGVVNDWMKSPGHRANILNCASKRIGVGVSYRGGVPYWTQVFGRA
jgi:uncharacterized protein YkwD